MFEFHTQHIEGRCCYLALTSGSYGRMIPRHMCYGDVALRLRHATASPSQKSNSAKNLMLPLRGLSCLRQHPHQRRRPLATPRASPPPLLLIPASRPVVPRLAAAGTRRAHSGRYICRSNPRRIFWPSRSTSRRFLSKADLPVTAAAAELNGDNGEHRRNRLRVRSKADQGGGIKQEQEEEPQQEQQKRGEKGSEAGKRRRVVVGMSGGVDSSVVAMLLQQQVSEPVRYFFRPFAQLPHDFLAN